MTCFMCFITWSKIRHVCFTNERKLSLGKLHEVNSVVSVLGKIMAAVAKNCESTGCQQPAKLRCPTCIKLGIHGSFFCSQVFANFCYHSVLTVYVCGDCH